ncbi:hypothetical protein L2D08_12910 [Domibacillus sp. PGB-M46]|uniref:hypothetical protein n=1 Tax=Domibacillus sp. PGB-M46 TaxID=2910255 RepID=UPI001F5958E3|nr:hypothetical protein [Domibacillus sp. PGB-M46]MCI2255268.1 hypothetical protein [Domibacillus sp. PGB-M46]
MKRYPRTGLKIKSEKGVHPEVKAECTKFCNWLQWQMTFDVRVVIYLKQDTLIKNRTTNEMAAATFFAPYDKEEEPYIRIATGSYEKLIVEYGKKNALYEILDSIAHEIIHYRQWLNDVKIDEEKAEEEGLKLMDQYIETLQS